MATANYVRGERLDTPLYCNAWLAPNGAMYYVDGSCNHDATSCIVNKCESTYCYACSDKMIDTGWLILSKGRTMYVNSGDTPTAYLKDEITQAQLDTLYDVFKDAVTKVYCGRDEHAVSQLKRILGIAE